MNIKKFLIYIFLISLVPGILVSAATVLRPKEGGTGLSSATAGDVGNCIKVLDDSPFTYELGTCGSGSGGGDSVWSRNTTTNLIYHATNTDSVAFGTTATSSPGTMVVDNFNKRVGIGTSSPYAKLSVVGGIVAEYLHATSTTATSTFAGAVQIGSTAGDSALRITAQRNYPTAASTGGMVSLFNTNNTSAALNVYSNAGASQSSLGLVFMKQDNVLSDGSILRMDNDGLDNALIINQNNTSSTLGPITITNAAMAPGIQINQTNASNSQGAIRIDSDTPEIEMVETDQVSPAGKWEWRVQNDRAQINSRNSADNSFEKLITFLPVRDGGGQGIGTQDDGIDARLEIVSTSTLPYLALSSTAAGTTGDTFIVTTTGNLGVATSSPYQRLSVADGNIHVGGVVTSTSTTAASTFPYASSTAITVSGEVDFDQLTSAVVLTGAGGVLAEYAGTACTNQFVRSLSALGAATCATVGAGDVSLANLTATDGTLTFSGTYNGSTARTIGINLASSNLWTAASTTFSGGVTMGTATTTHATTTTLYVSGTATTTFAGPIREKSEKSITFHVTTITAAGDFGRIWKAPRNITVTRVIVNQEGATNVVGQLQECDANGANCADIDSADITGTNGVDVADDGTLSNPSVDHGDYIGWDTTSVSGTNTRVAITFIYQESF